jgi:UDP-N-acetylglucosamine transferase subunit ALG13
VSTFITLGNSAYPFARLLDPLAELVRANRLPTPVYVQNGTTPFAAPGCTVTAFLDREQFEERLSTCTLLIAHCGLTPIQGARRGLVPVVMPRLARFGEHVDDHQEVLARALASEGRVVLAEFANELMPAVERALELQAQRKASGEGIGEPALVGRIRQLFSDWEATRR